MKKYKKFNKRYYFSNKTFLPDVSFSIEDIAFVRSKQNVNDANLNQNSFILHNNQVYVRKLPLLREEQKALSLKNYCVFYTHYQYRLNKV